MGFPGTRSARSLEFAPAAFDDLACWIEQDRKLALNVTKLIQAILRSPFEGIGQPERLKHDLADCWSRRIDQEHRLVYEVLDSKIRILACRFHY